LGLGFDIFDIKKHGFCFSASGYSFKCIEDKIYLYKKIWGFDFKKIGFGFLAFGYLKNMGKTMFILAEFWIWGVNFVFIF